MSWCELLQLKTICRKVLVIEAILKATILRGACTQKQKNKMLKNCLHGKLLKTVAGKKRHGNPSGRGDIGDSLHKSAINI